MVIIPEQYSFTAQRLKENNMEIWKGKKQILLPPKEIFYKKELKTKLVIGRELIEKTENIKNLQYSDLLKKGYKISPRRVKSKYFMGQRMEYFLTKISSASPDYGIIPIGHRVEYDVITQRLRLIGENSLSRWINIRDGADGSDLMELYTNDYADHLKSASQLIQENKTKEIEINEIPMLISEDNRLICLKEQKDNPIICFAGSKGKGKSLSQHRVIDQLYHKWNKKIININDPQIETDTWCLDWDDSTWIEIKKLNKIGEISLPLPMVYLHPKTISLNNVVYKNEIGFEISLSYKDCMMDYDNFFSGTRRELKKALMYLKNLLFNDDGTVRDGGLMDAKDYISQREIIDKEIPYKMVTVKDTLKTILKDLNNEKIFDITNKTPSRWKIVFPDKSEDKVYPWTACLMADLVPSILTYDLRQKDYFSQWIRFILNDLFKNQTQNEYFRKNRIELFIMIDEIQRLIEDPIISQSISRIARESRMSRIGIGYVPQNINKVPDDLSLVTNYVFAFKCNKEQASSLIDNYEMVSYKQKELLSLKKHEVILFTDESYVWYDSEGNSGEDDEPVKGNILPPNSMHKPPKIMKDD